MPLVNSEKNAQIGKVFTDVDTTSEIYQLFESNFNASDRKLHNLKLGNGEWGVGSGEWGRIITPNSKLQTPNSKLQTPNSKLQTPNS
ncbi:hypothetical protein GXM_01651 [Nostoc sphaeroides CCNUC1]|uniref:Uncharacterized protein n=2 Tax=Nostoc sphaeroides TaxID=446679 RepID=A0A5P8VUV1_9NOSO|nr:hypothetical protein GXM_01651 [Nostoc sphaeroides CCNUC1]